MVFAVNGLALLCGICAPCSNPIAVFFTVLIFIACSLFFSFSSYLVSNHRVRRIFWKLSSWTWYCIEDLYKATSNIKIISNQRIIWTECSDYSGCFVIHRIIKNFRLLTTLVLFSTIGNATFFFAAHRVDSRFVHGLVGTYEVSINIASISKIDKKNTQLCYFDSKLAVLYFMLCNLFFLFNNKSTVEIFILSNLNSAKLNEFWNDFNF